jgi:antitoxin component YwqK of YwqJK toxin-antitoxin module/ankyrin repeat protein
MSQIDIFRAAILGNKSIVRDLISTGSDINSINFQGKTPLLLAIEAPNISIDFIKFLIDEGADVNFRYQIKSQKTLAESEKSDHLDSEKNLDENSMKILDLLGNLNKNLLKCAPYFDEPVNFNLLDTAIKSKNLEIIEFILNYDFNVIYKNQIGLGAIYDFCSIFKTDRSDLMLQCLSSLLKKGCKDFNQNSYGERPIKFLAEYGHIDAVKLLVEFGDSIECLKWSENHKAVVFSDLTKLKENLNIFFDSTLDQNNRSPLTLFLHFRNATEIKELFNSVNLNDLNVGAINRGVELLVKADKINELKEVLSFFRTIKDNSRRLLKLSNDYHSTACLEFLLDLNPIFSMGKSLRKSELIEEIKNEFKEVKLNGGMGLNCAKSFDDYEYDKIDDMLEEEENWANISFDDLNDKSGGFRYFDSRGLLFHLPAYLVCELNYKFEQDLINYFVSEQFDRLVKKFSSFNYEQMRVTINCFEYFHQIGGSIDSEITDLKTKLGVGLNFNKKNISDLISNLHKILNFKLPLSKKNYTGKLNVSYENGVKHYEIEYKDGKINGKEIFWYSNGVKETETEYKEDLLNGKTTSWYSSGTLKSESEFKNGKQINNSTTWYENGAKYWEDSFNDKNGNPKGKSTSWYKNGNKEKEVGYLGDLPHGKYLKWDEKGNVLIDQDYLNGKMIKDNLTQKNIEGIDLE